jgi:hypothetical protein
MHRYEELEKLYYKNKIKKYLLSVALILGAVIAATVLSNMIKKSETSVKKSSLKKTENIVKKESNKPHDSVKEVKSVKPAEVKKQNIKPEQKNNIATSNKKEVNKTNLNLTFYIPNIQYKTKNNVTNQKAGKKEVKSTVQSDKKNVHNNENKNVTTAKTGSINEIKETNININELIQQFNKQPDFNLAILISKYYYNKENLANAKLWALKANNIDPSNYKSWEMFALILLKKNDKIKAKEVLKIYLNDYGDNEKIDNLLRSIDE